MDGKSQTKIPILKKAFLHKKTLKWGMKVPISFQQFTSDARSPVSWDAHSQSPICWLGFSWAYARSPSEFFLALWYPCCQVQFFCLPARFFYPRVQFFYPPARFFYPQSQFWIATWNYEKTCQSITNLHISQNVPVGQNWDKEIWLEKGEGRGRKKGGGGWKGLLRDWFSTWRQKWRWWVE